MQYLNSSSKFSNSYHIYTEIRIEFISTISYSKNVSAKNLPVKPSRKTLANRRWMLLSTNNTNFQFRNKYK